MEAKPGIELLWWLGGAHEYPFKAWDSIELKYPCGFIKYNDSFGEACGYGQDYHYESLWWEQWTQHAYRR